MGEASPKGGSSRTDSHWTAVNNVWKRRKARGEESGAFAGMQRNVRRKYVGQQRRGETRAAGLGGGKQKQEQAVDGNPGGRGLGERGGESDCAADGVVSGSGRVVTRAAMTLGEAASDC